MGGYCTNSSQGSLGARAGAKPSRVSKLKVASRSKGEAVKLAKSSVKTGGDTDCGEIDCGGDTV